MHHRFPRAVVAAIAFAFAACTDSAPVGPTSLSTSSSITTGGLWAREIVGETGPGSTYGIWVPEQWNGEAVFYAHGFKDVAASIDLPVNDSIAQLRDALGARGYAVAYSSFSENGFALEDGVRRTHQLSGLLASEIGRPSRSYLMGHSLGSLVVTKLSERHAGQYDGTLAMCGILGGTKPTIDYI